MLSPSFVARMEYWAVAGLLGTVSAAAIFRACRISWRRQMRSLALAVSTSGALTAIVIFFIPALFWIQWDETYLMATSVGMHSFRLNGYVVNALPDLPPEFTQDARSPLFPLLVSLAHDLFGFSLANAFLVNGLALFAILLLTHHAAVRRLGLPSALAAQLLLITSPVLLWCARSGGSDLISMFFLFAFLLGALCFTENPGAASFTWALGLGSLFAYTRYESGLPFALVIGAAIITAGPRGRSWRTLFPLLALPLMLAPLALHLLMTEGYRAFLGKARTFYGNELYSFSYMGPHLLAFLRRFFALDPSAPFTGLLHLLGVLSFFWHIRSRRDCARYGLLVLVGVLAPLFVLLGWVFIDAERAEILRLFLPISAIVSLLPSTILPSIPSRKGKGLFLALCAALFVARLPAAIWERAKLVSYPTVAIPLANRLVQEVPRFETPPLYVLDEPAFLLMQGHAAVSPAYFEAHLREVQAARDHGALGPVVLLDLFPENLVFPSRDLLQRYGAQELARAEDGIVRVRLLELLGPQR